MTNSVARLLPLLLLAFVLPSCVSPVERQLQKEEVIDVRKDLSPFNGEFQNRGVKVRAERDVREFRETKLWPLLTGDHNTTTLDVVSLAPEKGNTLRASLIRDGKLVAEKYIRVRRQGNSLSLRYSKTKIDGLVVARDKNTRNFAITKGRDLLVIVEAYSFGMSPMFAADHRETTRHRFSRIR